MKGRRLLVPAAVVVVAAVTVVLISEAPWSSDGTSSGHCDISDRISGESAYVAPGGGGIRIVEQGFSQEPDNAVSLGAVLENTSGSVAYRTSVTFQLFDESHTELPEGGTAGLTVEIPIMLPGQRIGTGSQTYRDKAKVASIAVGLSAPVWVSRGSLGKGYSPVTATYLRTARFNPEIPASVDIHYRESSTNCRSLDSRTTAVVFRDGSGKIVGGATSAPDTPIVFRNSRGDDLGGESRRPESPSCSPGDRGTWVVPPAGQPATADDTRTEIYPYCDLSVG